MVLRSHSEFSSVSSFVWNWWIKKVHRVQIRKIGRLWNYSHLVLCQKFMDKEWQMSRCIVMVQHSGFVSPLIRSLVTLLLLSTSWCSSKIVCWLTMWNKLMNDVHPVKKKGDQHRFHFSSTLTFFFLWGNGGDFSSHCDGDFCFSIIAICSHFISCYDMFLKVFIWELLTDCDVVRFLSICREMWHKFCNKQCICNSFSVKIVT